MENCNLCPLLNRECCPGDMPQEYEWNRAKELDLWGALRRRWILIMAGTLLLPLLIFICIRATYRPMYTAQVKLYVKAGTSAVMNQGELNLSRSLVNTYKEILCTHQTMDAVSVRLRASYDAGELENSTQNEENDAFYHAEDLPARLLSGVTCGSLNGTEILYISVRDRDPGRAVDAANMMAAVLPERIQEYMETGVTVVDLAQGATASESGLKKWMVAGAVLGFVFSVFLAVTIDCFSRNTTGKKKVPRI